MGFFDGLSGVVNSAAPLTNLIPGGGIANGIFSTVSGFFSGLGGGPKGTEKGNADKIAAAVGITQQQAMDLCAMVEDEAGDGGPNFDDIVKDYAEHPEEILGLIPRYNRKHPEKAITPQNAPTTGGAYQTPGIVSPYVLQTLNTAAQGFTPVVPRYVDQTAAFTAQQQQAQQFSVGGFGTAVLQGAQTGATDYLMDTPQGKAAKNEGAISWVKDNVVYFILGGIALGALIFKAFFSKK